MAAIITAGDARLCSAIVRRWVRGKEGDDAMSVVTKKLGFRRQTWHQPLNFHLSLTSSSGTKARWLSSYAVDEAEPIFNKVERDRQICTM